MKVILTILLVLIVVSSVQADTVVSLEDFLPLTLDSITNYLVGASSSLEFQAQRMVKALTSLKQESPGSANHYAATSILLALIDSQSPVLHALMYFTLVTKYGTMNEPICFGLKQVISDLEQNIYMIRRNLANIDEPHLLNHCNEDMKLLSDILTSINRASVMSFCTQTEQDK